MEIQVNKLFGHFVRVWNRIQAVICQASSTVCFFMFVVRNSIFSYIKCHFLLFFLLIVATAMPAKQKIKSKPKQKATTKKGNPVQALKKAKKVMEAKKVLKTQRMLHAEKEDDEDAREHDLYIQEQERKAAAKKKRQMAFDAKLIALTGVMDKILLLQWNSLHPSQPPPADLCMWKCKHAM